VVVHLGGNAVSGHFFADVRSPDGFWYKANDESVTRVKLDKVLSDKYAYNLCYTKVPIGTMVATHTEAIIIRSSKAFNNITNNYMTVRKTFLLSYVCRTFYLIFQQVYQKIFVFVLMTTWNKFQLIIIYFQMNILQFSVQSFFFTTISNS
jgi:hypothetical protein